MKPIELHFAIDGAWLTDFCRKRWADENAPLHAVDVLSKGFPMFGMNTIMQILTGHLKLVGTSDTGMTLEADAKQKTAAGNDLSFASVLDRTFKERLAKIVDKRFGPVFDKLTRAIEADDEDTASAKRFRKRMLRESPREIEKYKDFFGDEMKREMFSAADPQALMMLQYWENMGAVLDGKPGPLKGNLCGWLRPDGTFYPCHYFQHDALAVALKAKNGDELLKAGWVKVQEKTQGLIKKPADFYWTKKPTQAQIDKLWDWCQANNREFPKEQFDECP